MSHKVKKTPNTRKGPEKGYGSSRTEMGEGGGEDLN